LDTKLKKQLFDRLNSPATKKLRKKLVWGYTAAIILILMFSVTASFWVLKYFLSNSLRESLFLILDAEISESIPAFAAWKSGQKSPPSLDYSGNSTVTNEAAPDEQSFTVTQFWIAADGTLLMAENHLGNREALLSGFQNLPYRSREIQTLSVSSTDASKTWHFIVTADEVYRDGELLGKVVVGVNLMPFFRLKDLYYAVCFVTIAAVSVLAFFVGNYFAAKAILPVENAMEKQRHFVADASHELRTPLSILLSSVDLLNGENENQALIQGMKEEILNMRGLTKSLLALARSDENDVKRSAFDLSDVSRSVVNRMQTTANEKNIKIVLSVEDGVQAYGDEMKIGQLAGILIDNAIKYSPWNSIVRLDVTSNHGIVKIAVTDQGKGIPEEHLEHIFDRFYRVDKARLRQTGGYGLGLSIARNIAALHEGEIQVQSAEGQGSVFTVLLPMESALPSMRKMCGNILIC
jgi:signal transduction histidine kinase